MKATEASFAVAVYLCTYSEGFKLRCSRILDSHGVHSLYFNFPFSPLDCCSRIGIEGGIRE